MTREQFRKRIEQGKSVDYEYSLGDRAGLIAVWKHGGRIILTWEEAPLGGESNEHLFTRNERREFSSSDEAIEHLKRDRIDIADWPEPHQRARRPQPSPASR